MMAGKSFIFRFADVEVREREFSLTKAGDRLAVEPKAFRVLLILVRNPGKLIPKQELLDAVWGDAAVTENSISRAVALLRKVLGDEARTPRFIETVATVGYRFLGSVEAVEDPIATPPPFESGAGGSDSDATEPAASIAPPKRRFVSKILAVAAATTFAVFAAGAWYLSRPLPLPRITGYTQITHDGRDKQLGGTDGNRVYFTENSPNAIAQVGIKGGEIAPLTIAVPGIDPVVTDISPDGSHALMRTIAEGQTVTALWIVPLLGGAAKRLEDGEGESFSPDGSSVIYSTRTGDIFMVHLDGTDKHKLSNVGSAADGFRWSPDGKIIRFSKQDGLWEMSNDGTGIHRLLADWKGGVPCCGAWTQDAALFVFCAGDQLWALDERRSIFRRPPSIPIQLTSGPIGWSRPVPGRDKKTIFASGAARRGELSRIDLKTHSPQPIMDGISAEYLSFSPDGKSVTYVAYPEGTLWKANRDGSNPMPLTTPSSHEVFNPRWSPDCNQILFTTLDPDDHTAIHRISAVDGTPQWLLSEEAADMHDPSWSPDGKKVLFAVGWVRFPRAKLELRIVDLDTRQVTIVPDSAGRWSPRWSPDGRYVAALMNPETTRLRVFDMKLQRWSDLPTNGEVAFPSFSRDSKFIYFLRVGKDQGVFRIPVTGGKEERVMGMANWHLTGHFGASMTLDPTDAPLVLRDVGTNDIYALTLEP